MHKSGGTLDNRCGAWTERSRRVLNTPFFEKAKTYLGVEPQAVQPVYAPEVVSEVILPASERPNAGVTFEGANDITACRPHLDHDAGAFGRRHHGAPVPTLSLQRAKQCCESRPGALLRNRNTNRHNEEYRPNSCIIPLHRATPWAIRVDSQPAKSRTQPFLRSFCSLRSISAHRRPSATP